MAKQHHSPKPQPKAQPEPQPASPQPAPATATATATAQDPGFDTLWERFTVEANFSQDILDAEAEVIREEIARLEARIEDKRKELDAIVRREKTARDMLTMMLTAGFSHDAILSAMKVEFRAKKAARKDKEPEVNDDDKQSVLDVLDREGQPLQEIVKTSGREAKDVQRVLLALVSEGKVVTQGEKRARIYMLA